MDDVSVAVKKLNEARDYLAKPRPHHIIYDQDPVDILGNGARDSLTFV